MLVEMEQYWTISDAGCPGVADPGAEITNMHIKMAFKLYHLLDLHQSY